MSEGSFPGQYSDSYAEDYFNFPWGDSENDLEQLVAMTDSQLRSENYYRTEPIPEDNDLASSSYAESSSYEDASESMDDTAVPCIDRKRQRPKGSTRVAVKVPKGQPRSKRAARRAQILHEHGSVGATDHPKGKTRLRSGMLEWFNPEQNTFHAAAPLDLYRRQIIDEDDALGRYDYVPECGLHEDDLTSFCMMQKHWNLKDRKAWAHIRDQGGNEVLYLVEKPDLYIETPDPGFMIYKDLIMLDPDDHPIIDWPNIPRCFSSSVEGARIEALRRIYPYLSLPHFRARMPRFVLRKTVGAQTLIGLSSLQQRLTRFREIYDCPPWHRDRVARGADLSKSTRQRLAREGLDLGSTAGLEPLTRREVIERKKPHIGKCPENAGIYTLTEEEAQRKAARERSRREEAQAKRRGAENEIAPVASFAINKRKRDTSEQPSQRHIRPASFTTMGGNQSASLISVYGMPPAERAASFSNIATHSDEYGSSHEDLRWVAPRTTFEQLSIKAALAYTLADFRYYNSPEHKKAPVTQAWHSFFDQYQQIQSHHEQAWFLDTPAPQLIYIPIWLNSFQLMPFPDEENMKRLLPMLQKDAQPIDETSGNLSPDAL